MEVIYPQFVGDAAFGDDTLAELLSSSIAAPTEATWAGATTYALNDLVKYQITEGEEKGIWKIFKSLAGSNTGNNPYSSPTFWSDQGAPERWKMFDYLAMSQTTDAVNDIAVNLHCRRIDAISFMNVQALEIEIAVYEGSALADKIPANLIQEITLPLTQPFFSWQAFFLDDFRWVRDVSTPIEISLYYDVVLQITFKKITGEDCAVGQCLPGRLYNLGTAEMGLSAGRKDYTKVVENEDTGYTSLSPGPYKKLLSCDLSVPNDRLNEVDMITAQLRGKPTVFQGNPGDAEYNCLLIYGFIRDFKIVMRKPLRSMCYLEVRGLI